MIHWTVAAVIAWVSFFLGFILSGLLAFSHDR